MKVLFVIDSLGRGGAEQVLALMLPELRRQGVGVALAVRGGAMDLLPVFEAEGIKLHRMTPRHRWNLIGAAREIASIARAEQADVVHAHLYFPAVATALMGKLRLVPVRTCVTFHNLAYAGANRPGLRLTFRRRLAGLLYRGGSIDRFFGVSAAVARHYEANLSLPSVTCLPNPIDLQPVRDLAKEVRPEPGRIVMPGRLVPEKGHADLFAALALLASRDLYPEVIVAGGGPLRDHLEGLVVSSGLGERVHFVGTLERPDMLRLIASAEIVVVPSRFEGFGLIALEAMALGRPVIATRAGGIPEVIGDAGLLVPVADPPALAEALATLLADAGMRMELAAHATVRADRFNLPGVVLQQILVYRKLMN